MHQTETFPSNKASRTRSAPHARSRSHSCIQCLGEHFILSSPVRVGGADGKRCMYVCLTYVLNLLGTEGPRPEPEREPGPEGGFLSVERPRLLPSSSFFSFCSCCCFCPLHILVSVLAYGGVKGRGEKQH